MDPDKTLERPVKRPSRLLSAWMALRGDPVVPVAIRAEWVAWQFELQGLMDKLTVCAARLYERDRVKLAAAMKRVDELEAGVGSADPEQVAPANAVSTWNPQKIALYRAARALTGTRTPNGTPALEHSDVASD